jgi:transposase
MSELTEDVSRRKRRFSEEFKRDAVRLIVEEGYTFKSAATAVGVSEPSLRAWHAKYAPPPEPCGDGATVAELRGEVARLRKQLKRAELEREILKKATAYFAKESL